MSTEAQRLEYSATELENYLAGDLEPARAAEIERTAQEDPDLNCYLDERRAERDAFLLDPRRRNFASLEAEASMSARPKWWALGVGFSFVAAVAAVMVLMPRDVSNTIQTKGGLSVKTAVLDGSSPRLFDATQPLYPGHRLRLTVDDPNGGFLTVLLEEASGQVELLYRPDELGELRPGSHLLPGSLELDDVVGRERLYVIMSNDRPDPKTWMSEIRRAHERSGFQHGWLPPRGSRVQTIEYDKVRAP